jgi:heme exporter protein A
MLQVNALSCHRQEEWLFKALDFSVSGGELLEIRGDNGAGKTTLFKILAGLFDDFDGEVKWDLPGPPLFVGHRFGLNAQLSPAENLSFLMALNQGASSREDLEAALERFNLADVVDQPCRNLSEGQRKRVALSRLQLTDARVWLLDEAFSALDAKGRQVLTELCQDQIAQGGAVIFSSHQPVEGFGPTKVLALGKSL